MKKKLFLILILVNIVFTLTTTSFATEKIIDFTNFKTKKINNSTASFNSDEIIIPANKWATCSANIKVVLEPGCKMKSQTFANGNTHVWRFNTYVRTYDKNGKACDSLSSNLKETGKWIKEERKTRMASGYDRIDRSIGLTCNTNGILRGENEVKKAKIEFDGIKGIYNGDAYDAICKISDDIGLVCSVLYKDVKIDADHDCDFENFGNFVKKEIVDDENNKVYAIFYPTLNEELVTMQIAVAGYVEPGYRTTYKSEIDPAYENTLILSDGINIKGSDDNDFIDKTNGYTEIYGSYSDGEDNEIEPFYHSVGMAASSWFDSYFKKGYVYQTAYIYFGILKPEKVTKDNKEVQVTYEYLPIPGIYKETEYDAQLVMKEGNNIIGRAMFKNAFVEKK